MVDRSHSEAHERRRERWSVRMLPWMSGMVLGLTIFFFFASAAQLVYLHYEITRAPEGDFTVPMEMLRDSQLARENAGQATERLPAAAIAALTALERNAMERRYHQANVSLLSRVWTRYLGFVTGMVLAMVGAAFILGRLETTTSTAGGEAGGAKFNLQSDSPGLLLAAFGVVLMITTIVTHHEIHVEDRAIYAQGWSIGSQESPQMRPAQDGAAKSRPQPLSAREGQQDAGGVEPSPALSGVRERLRTRDSADETR